MKSRLFILLALVLSLISLQKARGQQIDYHAREVLGGLNVPWEIRWGNDGWIWFTERPGRISRVHPETGQRKLLLTAPTVLQIHESGMLGFDFHPQFPDSPYLYVAFTHDETWPAKLDLFRYTYEKDTLLDRKLILTGMRSNYTHVGCRVVVHGDKIFLSVGETGNPPLAQDTSSLNGKILRINLDGSIPEDNPFPGSPLWTIGHRNPQGLVFGPTGQLYSTEHGTDIDDEMNLIVKGKNYGWPYVEGNCDRPAELLSCDTLEVQQPLYDWLGTLGVSGMDFYYHAAIPEWRNSILVAALRDETISTIKLDATGKKVLQYRRFPPVITSSGTRAGRLRDFCISPEGRVFISTSKSPSNDEDIDMIFEISRKGVFPYTVSLVDPSDKARIMADSIRFAWNRTAGDSEYQLQLSNDSNFSQGKVVFDQIVADTFFNVRHLAEETYYYWRVRELTSQGPWSSIRALDLLRNSVAARDSDLQLKVILSQSQLKIEFPSVTDEAAILRIVNTLGQRIFTKKLDSGEREYHLDLESMASGSYWVTYSAGDLILTTSFRIVR
jgi:glucose/arabinose dehydrogenase